MSAKPFIARNGLCTLAVGLAASLAVAVGTLYDASNRIGFYSDVTASAEKLAMVVGGIAGPIYTRSGSVVNVAHTGAISTSDATAASSTSTGSGKFGGGIGVIGAGWFGGLINSASTITGTQLVSTVAIGTAPLVVTSTTAVANLNASLLLGNTWAAPAAIGSGTPAAGTFSSLTVGTGTGNGLAVLAGAAGSNRFTRVYSGAGTTTSNLRWDVGADGTAEGGANAGSPFLIVAYSDSGAFIDSPVSITRAAGGAVTIVRPVNISYASAFLTVGSGASDCGIVLNGAAATNRRLRYQTAGVTRWQMLMTTDAETGSDAGGSLRFQAFTDAGAQIDTPLTINRAAGTAIGTTRPLSVVVGAAGTGITVSSTGGATRLTIDDATAGGGADRQLYFTNTGAASKINWRLGAQITTDNVFEIGHSTVAGGSTYTTDFTIDSSGNAAFAGNVAIGSGKTLTLGNAYTATPPTCTGYVMLKDSTGTTYKVLVST